VTSKREEDVFVLARLSGAYPFIGVE